MDGRELKEKTIKLVSSKYPRVFDTLNTRRVLLDIKHNDSDRFKHDITFHFRQRLFKLYPVDVRVRASLDSRDKNEYWYNVLENRILPKLNEGLAPQ